jgi:hypothetical protein
VTNPFPPDWGYEPDEYTIPEMVIIGDAAVPVLPDLAPVYRSLTAEIASWGIPITLSGVCPLTDFHSVGAALDICGEVHTRGDKRTVFPIRKLTNLCNDLGLVWGRTLETPAPAHFHPAMPLPLMKVISDRIRPTTGDRPPFRRSLSQGDNGPAVLWIQHRLTEAGFYGGPLNGRFLWEVQRAVRRFQSERGAKITGVVNLTTYDLLLKG